MSGYWRGRLTVLADVAGVDGPPRGGLRQYADDLLAGGISEARAMCTEQDDERLAALNQMERIALQVVVYDDDEKAVRARPRAARAPRKATSAPALARLSVRDRYRTRRSL